MAERWLSRAQALQLIQRRLNAPLGPAQVMLDKHIDSREVQLCTHADSPFGAGRIVHIQRDHINGRRLYVVQGRSAILPGLINEEIHQCFVLINRDDLEYRLKPHAPAIDPPTTGGAKAQAAAKAILKTFPNGVPDRTMMGNAALVEAVRENLSPAWNEPVIKGGMHDSTILRAAGRKDQAKRAK